jgi:hypothetical protein
VPAFGRRAISVPARERIECRFLQDPWRPRDPGLQGGKLTERRSQLYTSRFIPDAIRDKDYFRRDRFVGRRRFAILFDAAGNGAFVQPVRLNVNAAGAP